MGMIFFVFSNNFDIAIYIYIFLLNILELNSWSKCK